MYPRFTRKLYQTVVLSGFLRKNPCLLTIPSYRRFLEITSNPTSSFGYLCSSSTVCREADTTALCDNTRAMAFNIGYGQLLEAQKDDNVLIVDVREHSEIDETGKLPGSIHIPMDDVKNIFRNLSEEEFKKRYGKHKPNKDTKIIFSCRSGRRSGAVQEEMQKLGYTKAYNYIGGWMEWESKQNK